VAEVINKEFQSNPSIANYIVLMARWTDIKKLVAAVLFATRQKNKYVRHLKIKKILK